MAFIGVGILGGTVLSNVLQKSPSAPDPRNLGNELGAINSQYTNLQDYLTGGQGFNQSGSNALNGIVNGTNIDWAKYAQTPAAQKHIQESNDYYNSIGAGNWSDAQKAQNFYVNGYDPNAVLPTSGGIGDLNASLNTASRTSNINDVKNLAQDYTNILKGTNQDYYNQLNHFTQSANAPVTPSASQTQAANLASTGYGTFNPTGLNANTSFTYNPISSQGVTPDQGNPLLSALNSQALSQGPSQLQTQQNALASQLLSQGGNLSPSDLRNIQQNSRAGFAARGLDATNASVVDETFQTDQAQRARLLQNLATAQGIQNQGLNEQNLQNQFALGVGGQNLNYSQLGLQGQEYNNNANLQAQQANQAANLQTQQLGLQGQIANQNLGLNAFNANLNSQTAQQQALAQSANLYEQQRQAQLQAQLAATQAQQQGTMDPYAAILSGTNNNLLGNAINLYGTTQGTQNNLINALYGYGSDLNNTNYNAQAAANIAKANQSNQTTGSLLGLAGTLGSAYLKSGAV